MIYLFIDWLVRERVSRLREIVPQSHTISVEELDGIPKKMASAFGWYGPLIDIRSAPSHIGDFVQLLVFVHRSFPVQVSLNFLSLFILLVCIILPFTSIPESQYKSSKGGYVTRTDIQVGDDTTPYFGVSLWQKDMGSKLAPGDVVLLQSIYLYIIYYDLKCIYYQRRVIYYAVNAVFNVAGWQISRLQNMVMLLRPEPFSGLRCFACFTLINHLSLRVCLFPSNSTYLLG